MVPHCTSTTCPVLSNHLRLSIPPYEPPCAAPYSVQQPLVLNLLPPPTKKTHCLPLLLLRYIYQYRKPRSRTL